MTSLDSDNASAGASESGAPGPLAGVSVLDFTHILAGPFCTQLLADAGADVIKVEPPDGEWARQRGPKRVYPDGSQISSYFAAVNRGKRSIRIDLKSDAGRALALRLISDADILVENFSPGTLTRLGLDLTDLRARFPRLITASVSLFGGPDTAGALSGRGGLAIVAEAESSLMSQHRGRDGRPITTPYGLGDMASGLAAYGAITTALFERTRTGVGRHLDIAMIRVLLSLNAISITGEQIAAETGSSEGGGRTAAMGIFQARDGYIAFGVNSDSLFQRFAAATGIPQLLNNPLYQSHATRDRRVDDVDHVVEEWTKDRSVDEIIGLLAPTGVPCGRVNTPADILRISRAGELDLLEEVADGAGGIIRSPANPFGFRRAPTSLPSAGGDGCSVVSEESPEEAQHLCRGGEAGRDRTSAGQEPQTRTEP